MGEALFFGGIGGGDEETLFAYVREYLFELLVRVFSFYQADIYCGDGFFGDYILSLLPTYALRRPRIFREGYWRSSIRRLPSPSGLANWRSRSRWASLLGMAASASFFVVLSGTMSS